MQCLRLTDSVWFILLISGFHSFLCSIVSSLKTSIGNFLCFLMYDLNPISNHELLRCGPFIYKVTILVTCFTTPSDIVLRAYYGYTYLNVGPL